MKLCCPRNSVLERIMQIACVNKCTFHDEEKFTKFARLLRKNYHNGGLWGIISFVIKMLILKNVNN